MSVGTPIHGKGMQGIPTPPKPGIPVFDDPVQEELCRGLINKDGLRVRREWRELSGVQKALYVEAVREVWKRGEWLKTLWFHEQLGIDEMLHASNHFLHWHRWYTFTWENQLRALGPKFR